MIRRVLIANRGEIALRIIRTCRAAGIESVAVYSDADAGAPHVSAADTAIRIGPPPSAESYLNIPSLMSAVRQSGADAVHPGYGFLSENAAFCETCERAGVTFVGAPASVMRRMGSKAGARAVATAAGVPVVPGAIPASDRVEDFAEAADRVGWPVLLKAAAGGGGKGMRIVRSARDLNEAIGAARQEAVRAFGHDALYVERLIEGARHIEVQVFGDRHGSIVHLVERDCTLQRRHQKVIEETPAPSLPASVRTRLTEAAVAVARAVGYVGAGTVEFLVEDRGEDARFYFLELNMRLQVEHPITEAVTGLDLVRLQLIVAAGEPLPFAQADVRPSGHAIECRVYAEDARRLLPQTGRLLRYREPSGTGVRIDSGVVEGQDVTVHYDPLLAKLVVHAGTRDAARQRALDALRAYEILGVRHNIAFLSALLAHPDVAAHRTHTRFIEEHLDELARDPPDAMTLAAVAMAAFVASDDAPAASSLPAFVNADPWDTIGRF